MSSFKIQLIKQQALLPSPALVKSVPKLSIGIQSIVCLNYPIETLSQVINLHFDDEPCSANTIVKALKVISISLKDKQLRANIEKILIQNVHKRQKIYLLFQYWASLMTNLSSVLNKFEQKTVETAVGCVISEYCFTPCNNNPQVSKMISLILSNTPLESANKMSQYAKNQFISMGCPIAHFIGCPQKLNFKDEKTMDFFIDLANSLIKTKQSQFQLQLMLQNYFNSQEMRDKIDRFFMTFPHISSHFTSNLIPKLRKDQIMGIWETSAEYKMDHWINSGVKQWARRKDNFWGMFEINFNQIRQSKRTKTMLSLLNLGLQLESTILSSSLIKQYLYNYLNGTVLSNANDNLILEEMAVNKQSYKKIHLATEIMNDMMKSNQNIVKSERVNLMTINKIYAPNNWAKTDLKMLKSVSIPIIKPFIDKLCTLFQKQEQRNNEKGKKIELAYHSIIIQVAGQNESSGVVLTVTLHQLATMIKQRQLPPSIHIADEYRPTEAQTQKQEMQKQIQSIVIEAKLVKAMKKSKQKLNFHQLYSQIKDLNISEQNCRLALNKVISKGIISEESEGFFIYCP